MPLEEIMNKCLEIFVELFRLMDSAFGNDVCLAQSPGLGSHLPPDQLLGVLDLLNGMPGQ